MPVRCALGCKKSDRTMHVFPNPEKDPERFKAWVEVLGKLTPASLTDDEIHKRLRICDEHFINDHRARFKRLTAMAVPCRNLPASSVVETETEENDKREPIETDSSEDGEVEICDDSDDKIVAEVIIKPEVSSDDGDAADVLSPATPEESIDPNDPKIKPLLEDDSLMQSIPVVTSIHDTDTAERAEFYHRRWLVARKRLAIRNNQLRRMRRKMAANRLSKKQVLKSITKNMTEPGKLFLAMQMRISDHDFTMEEKELSLSIYKKSPECYKLLTDYFVLPSSETMQRMNLESGSCKLRYSNDEKEEMI